MSRRKTYPLIGIAVVLLLLASLFNVEITTIAHLPSGNSPEAIVYAVYRVEIRTPNPFIYGAGR